MILFVGTNLWGGGGWRKAFPFNQGNAATTRRQISKCTRLLGAILRASFTLALLEKNGEQDNDFDLSSLAYSGLFIRKPRLETYPR